MSSCIITSTDTTVFKPPTAVCTTLKVPSSHNMYSIAPALTSLSSSALRHDYSSSEFGKVTSAEPPSPPPPPPAAADRAPMSTVASKQHSAVVNHSTAPVYFVNTVNILPVPARTPVPKAQDTLGFCNDHSLAVANDLRSLHNSSDASQMASPLASIGPMIDEVLQLVNSLASWHQKNISSVQTSNVSSDLNFLHSKADQRSKLQMQASQRANHTSSASQLADVSRVDGFAPASTCQLSNTPAAKHPEVNVTHTQ